MSYTKLSPEEAKKHTDQLAKLRRKQTLLVEKYATDKVSRRAFRRMKNKYEEEVSNYLQASGIFNYFGEYFKKEASHG